MAFDGEVRLLEKEAMARLPEWQPLLTRRVELANPEGQALTILAGQAKSLPDEELKALIDRLEKLEAEDLKQLPSGD